MTDRVVVWSERNELHDPTGSEHDCAYSAILMVLVHGGKLDYPLGIYTALEREALERSDNEPDETGANPADIDLAILTRYGLGAHAPTTDIRTLLTTPGLAVSVGGQLSAFPAGDPLRRWAPNYLGGHRITFLTSSRTWLDPLAPWKFAGDTVSVDKVITFAAKRAVSDLRYLSANELAASTGGTAGGVDIVGLSLSIPSVAAEGTITVAVGKTVYKVADASAVVLDVAASPRPAYAVDHPGHEPGYLLDITAGGTTEAYFVRAIDSTFTPDGGKVLAPGKYVVPA